MTDYSEHPLNNKTDIDSAVNAGWQFYKKYFLSLYAISLVTAFIGVAFSSGIDIASLQTTTDPHELIAIMKPMLGNSLIISLVSIFFNLLLQYYIIMKPVDPEYNFINSIGYILSRIYFPLLAVYIVLAIFAMVAFIFGILLLFVGLLFAIPYVILFFALTAPVMIIEKRGIGEAITRLIKLVHMKFWPNMGWMSVYILFALIFSFIVSAIIMIPFSGSLFKSIMNPDAGTQILEFAGNPSFIILSSLTGAITIPLLPILALLIYFHNRSVEMGNTTTSGFIDEEGDNTNKISSGDNNKSESFTPTVDDLHP
ncbi:MAG: hypothetical protein K8R35_05405 [Bacteroidales bacterium]|nr:hypothetical protein [Bacteroidales bacterium]